MKFLLIIAGLFAVSLGTVNAQAPQVDASLSAEDAEVYYAATAMAPNCGGQCQMNVIFSNAEPGWLIVNCGGTRCSCWGSPDLAWYQAQGVTFQSVNAHDCHK